VVIAILKMRDDDCKAVAKVKHHSSASIARDRIRNQSIDADHYRVQAVEEVPEESA
jgi:hypothetical protein